MKKIRLLITEEENEEGTMLDQMIEREKELILIGVAHSEDEVLLLMEQTKPDVFIRGEVLERLFRERDEKKLLRPRRPLPYHLPDTARLLRESAMEIGVTELIHEIGIPAHIKGYNYLRDAILLAVMRPEAMDSVTKVLYPSIARKYDTIPTRVERAIRHAIEVAWMRGNADTIQQIFGYTVDDGRGKPTNSEFVALLADRIRLRYRAEDVGESLLAGEYAFSADPRWLLETDDG